MNNRERNENKPGKWIGLVIALLVTAPELFIPIGVFAAIVYAAIRVVKARQSAPRTAQRPTAIGKPAKSDFDDCPQPLFCFHKDKGEHHVSRGKEIDPWDRPDIDISKYQHRR